MNISSTATFSVVPEGGSQVQDDPRGIVVAAVASPSRSTVYEGTGLLRRESGTQPEVVEELVFGRLPAWLESVRPRRHRRRRGVRGGGARLGWIRQTVDEAKRR